MSYKAQLYYLINTSKLPPEDLNSAIDSFKDDWLELHSFDEPLGFYHYTSFEGLNGILDSRSIWFSHISTLNDPLELQYGKRIILDKLNDFGEKETNLEIIKILKVITKLIEAFDQNLYHAYIACFCEKDNLLSQWRSYAEKGGGYNLGFLFNAETKFSNEFENLSHNTNVTLRKVIYDQETQNIIITKLITSIVETTKNVLKNKNGHISSLNDAWEYHTSLEVVNLFFDMILSFKNPVFEEEKEWRLIQVSAQNHKSDLIKFRYGRHGLIPYLETYVYKNLDESIAFPLQSIRFGPLLEEGRTKASLSLFLNKKASLTNHISINSSEVRVNGAGYTLRT